MMMINSVYNDCSDVFTHLTIIWVENCHFPIFPSHPHHPLISYTILLLPTAISVIKLFYHLSISFTNSPSTQARRWPAGQWVPVGAGPVLLSHQWARLGGNLGPLLWQTNCQGSWGVGLLPGTVTTLSFSSTSSFSSTGGYERSPPARPYGSDRNAGPSHLARHRLCCLHLRCEHSLQVTPQVFPSEYKTCFLTSPLHHLKLLASRPTYS